MMDIKSTLRFEIWSRQASESRSHYGTIFIARLLSGRSNEYRLLQHFVLCLLPPALDRSPVFLISFYIPQVPFVLFECFNTFLSLLLLLLPHDSFFLLGATNLLLLHRVMQNSHIITLFHKSFFSSLEYSILRRTVVHFAQEAVWKIYWVQLIVWFMVTEKWLLIASLKTCFVFGAWRSEKRGILVVIVVINILQQFLSQLF